MYLAIGMLQRGSNEAEQEAARNLQFVRRFLSRFPYFNVFNVTIPWSVRAIVGLLFTLIHARSAVVISYLYFTFSLIPYEGLVMGERILHKLKLSGELK